MNDLRKAAEQALEALENVYGKGKRCEAAIKELRQALAQPEQEPYGYFRYDMRLDAWVQNRENTKGVAFYTAPPKRKWVGLTDGEIESELTKEFAQWWSRHVSVCRTIEARLKEKNG